MSGQKKRLGAFRLIHLLLCIGLFFWAFWFWGEHTPARQVWLNMTQAQRHIPQEAKPSIAQKVNIATARIKAIMPIVLPDVGLGVGVLILFSFSTGWLVKRLDTYLKMSGSGDVASVRGIGIQSQALESNVGRRGGIHEPHR
jgi:hypothetical protein